MSSARKQLVPVSTILVIGGAIALAVAFKYALGREQYINEPLHSTIEAVGGCIAVGMAVLLFARWLEDGPAHFVWMSSGLLCMGLLDLAHACIGHGPAFFWSRALPTLVGGVLMGLVWLPPASKQRVIGWLRPPLISATVTFPVCLLLVLLPDEWPNAFAADGSYMLWARLVNIAGGLGFGAAALFFLRRNSTGEHREADLVFANHSAIFALAALLFGLSYVWNAVWWLFHVMRLTAYVVVLKYSVDVFRRAITERAEVRQIEFERRLLGIVGHDLRNPLNAILLSTQVLQQMEMPPKAAKTFARLQQAGERMKRLIAELLDFSHSRTAGIIPVHPSEVDLQSLCNSVREEFAASHPKAVTVCESSGDVTGQWDRDRLHQLLANLVENAIKYGDKTSPITIRTRGDSGRVTLEVHSRGTPIPPDLLPHIFQPFRTGASQDVQHMGSHGLGLFIVREVVRAHNGEISVESSAEDGTCFRILLPRL